MKGVSDLAVRSHSRGADFSGPSISLFHPWPLALGVLSLINIFIRSLLSVCCVPGTAKTGLFLVHSRNKRWKPHLFMLTCRACACGVYIERILWPSFLPLRGSALSKYPICPIPPAGELGRQRTMNWAVGDLCSDPQLS